MSNLDWLTTKNSMRPTGQNIFFSVAFLLSSNNKFEKVISYRTWILKVVVRSQLKFGFTDETKEIMAKRDSVRKNLTKTSPK